MVQFSSLQAREPMVVRFSSLRARKPDGGQGREETEHFKQFYLPTTNS